MDFFGSSDKLKEKFYSIIFWIFLWIIMSNLVDNNILLPNPLEVGRTLYDLIQREVFWISILNSIINIGTGFLISILLGVLLGFISYSIPILKSILDLPINLIKSIPIASITIVLLIWINSTKLTIFIVLFISLPNIYFSSLAGLESVDNKLLEMAHVFGAKRSNIFRFLYWDSLKEFLVPSITVTSGLAWKSGVSGEVLGLVNNSIGENIYYSKLYLNTEELFAWTFMIILLANLFQLVISKIMEGLN